MSAPTDPDDHESLLEPRFSIVRRGYDPAEVRRLLQELAAELRAGREREARLNGRLEEADARAAAVDPLDPSHLTKLLGDAVARILDAARAAATEIRQRADEAAIRLHDETKAEAEAEAAAITERAAVEAWEILRVAEEQRDKILPGVSSDPAPIPVPSQETTSRPGRRRGVDPDRTTDLFASLRAQHDAPSPPESSKSSKSSQSPKASKPSKSSKSSKATKSPKSPKASKPSKAMVVSSTPDVLETIEVPGDPGTPRSPKALSVDLEAILGRILRRQLADDLNSLLAEVMVPGRRTATPPANLPADSAPIIERYALLIGTALEELISVDFPDRDASIAQLSRLIAADLVIPLRRRLDLALDAVANGAADHSVLPGAFRSVFREWRDETTTVILRSALAELPHRGDAVPI